jgi:hypothetical protein
MFLPMINKTILNLACTLLQTFILHQGLIPNDKNIQLEIEKFEKVKSVQTPPAHFISHPVFFKLLCAYAVIG